MCWQSGNTDPCEFEDQDVHLQKLMVGVQNHHVFINPPFPNAGGGSFLQRVYQEKGFKEPRWWVFQDRRCCQQVCPSFVFTCTLDQQLMFICTHLFMCRCEGMPSTTQERVFLSKRWAVIHMRKKTYFLECFLRFKANHLAFYLSVLKLVLKILVCSLFIWCFFSIARRDCSGCEDVTQCICGR